MILGGSNSSICCGLKFFSKIYHKLVLLLWKKQPDFRNNFLGETFAKVIFWNFIFLNYALQGQFTFKVFSFSRWTYVSVFEKLIWRFLFAKRSSGGGGLVEWLWDYWVLMLLYDCFTSAAPAPPVVQSNQPAPQPEFNSLEVLKYEKQLLEQQVCFYWFGIHLARLYRAISTSSQPKCEVYMYFHQGKELY